MSREEDNRAGPQNTQAKFTQTQWTLIIKAGGPTSTEARNALNQLCQNYWYPIYAFIRSKGNDSHKAKDLTQSFFVHLLRTDLIKKVDQREGRFRNFLLACLINFLHDEHRRDKAEKHGGAVNIISIDEEQAEERYGLLSAHDPDPANVFDGTWAATVIEQVTMRLKHSYGGRGRVEVYEALKGCLTGQLDPASYPEIAARLEMSKETFETNLSRFKKEFGKLVQSVIAETVADEKETQAEIRHLMAAWVGYLERKALTKPS